MIDVVLCELEGVVAETSAPRHRALMHAFAAEGIAAPRIPTTARGPLRADVVRALEASGAKYDATLVDLLLMRSTRHFVTEASTGMTLAAGVVETLTVLHLRSRLALVTRAPRDVAERALSLGALDGLFEVVISADDVVEEKPHPEGHRAALERLTRRRPVRAPLALEDDITGVRAARAAGLPCIVVGPVPAHQALEASAVIDRLPGHTLESLSALVGRDGARVA